MSKILIVDDEVNVQSSFRKILIKEGHEIFTANNSEEGLLIAEKCPLDLLIMDIRMPGMSGLEAFSKFKKIDSKMPIIIMTAYGSTETAIEAMQMGAYDYIIKPFEVPLIKVLIEKALEAAKIMKTEVVCEPKEKFDGYSIIGTSSEMQQIYKTIGQVAASDVPVLLRGESGTGKELIARAIYSYSQRKNSPFLIINSAAIPETILESELFGYEKGAFTDAKERRIGRFEQCNGGTLFLDEIGDMPASIQAKILRVLENKTFERLGGNKTISSDVRVITATNRNLEILITDNKFRKDLYYRLNVVTINIPPLRERKGDIPMLVKYFMRKYGKDNGRENEIVSAAVLKKMQGYDWPGNVRELENVIRKAILFSRGSIILPEHILLNDDSIPNIAECGVNFTALLAQVISQRVQMKTGTLYKDIIEEAEKTLITEAVKISQGNQSQAARLLGISRPTLKDKIEKLGLVKIVGLKEI
ncbi:MAG: sigma-54 dependent transcriptional regulator [Candidatus Omnitrophota bacterium]